MNIPPEVLTVTEARSRLRELITAGRTVFIGSHRRAQAVFVPLATYRSSLAPPPATMRDLLAASAIGTAARTRRTATRSQTPPPSETRQSPHPGAGGRPEAGSILGWLWSTGQHEDAMRWITALLREQREYGCPCLDDVLDSITPGLLDELPEPQVRALLESARTQVPTDGGSDLSTPTGPRRASSPPVVTTP